MMFNCSKPNAMTYETIVMRFKCFLNKCQACGIIFLPEEVKEIL